MITIFTRVTEKGPHWTAMLLQRSMDELVTRNIMQHVNIMKTWKDNAVSYKSLTMFSFNCFHFLERYGISVEKGGIHLGEVPFQHWDQYGEACHLKGDVDRYFRVLSKRVDKTRHKKIVKGMADIHQCCETGYMVPCDNNMEEKFISFWPTEEKSSWVRNHMDINKDTLPCRIRASNAFQHRCADIRRSSLLGNDKLEITGVKTKAMGVPGMKVEGSGVSCSLKPFIGPVFQQIDALEEQGSETEANSSSESDSAVEVDLTDIPEQQKSYRGWKVSYRTKKPEAPVKEKVLKRNVHRNRGLEWLHDRLPKATRHMEGKGRDMLKAKERARNRSKADAEYRSWYKNRSESGSSGESSSSSDS